MEVAGKIVVVTGGAHGIGRALVERFAREGAKHVVVVDLDEARTHEVAKSIGGSGHRVDVASEAAVAALVDDVERDHRTDRAVLLERRHLADRC